MRVAPVRPAVLPAPTRLPPFAALVIYGHPFVRDAMTIRLRQLGAAEVIEAASADEARVRRSVAGPRDLCLLGFAMLAEGRDPLAPPRLMGELDAGGWRRVLVLSGPASLVHLRAAFMGGARGYLVGSPASAERSAATPPLPDPGLTGWDRRARRLSARELQVLRLVADGHSNRDAGDTLNLSALTVKSHLARIARKLGTGDRAHMVILALRAGDIS